MAGAAASSLMERRPRLERAFGQDAPEGLQFEQNPFMVFGEIARGF